MYSVCVCVCVVWTCLSACISEYCLRVLNYNQLFDFINFEENFHPAVQFTYHISDTSVTFLDIRSLKTHCGLNPVPTSPVKTMASTKSTASTTISSGDFVKIDGKELHL